MAVRIDRVYTRKGDKGTTALVGGTRVAKDSPRLEAYGAIDELNAVVGLARAFARDMGTAGAGNASLDDLLKALQNELFDLGSELATPPTGEYEGMFRIGAAEVTALEKRIEEYRTGLEPLRSFVLPGGGRVTGCLHLARTVCRRAERDILRLSRGEPVGKHVLAYINRLGDLLFVLSRWVAKHCDEEEHLWQRGLRRPRQRAGGRARKES